MVRLDYHNREDKTEVNTLNRWKIFTEWLSLLFVMNLVCVCFYDLTRFSFSIFHINRKLLVALPLVLGSGLRFLVCFLEDFKKEKKEALLKAGLAGLFSLPCMYLAFRFRYISFAYLAFAVLCLYKVDTDRVLKCFFVLVGLLMVGTVLCSLTGAVFNRVIPSLGENHAGTVRSDYGVISCTDLAAYFPCLLSYLWCTRERARDKWNVLGLLILTLGSAWWIYVFTNTITGTALCLLLAGLMLWDAFVTKYWVLKRPEWIRKIADSLLTWAFPLLGMLFYVLVWLYGRGISLVVRLDTLTHSRISIAWRSLQKYGLHALGALTPQNGNGGDWIHPWQGEYDFLDSTYGLLLIRYGWVFTLIAAFLWVWMTRRALKSGRRRLACVMALIALQSFSEHHFPEVNYNILLATPLCVLEPASHMEAEEKKDTWIPWLSAAVVTALSVLLLPKTLSFMRTVFEIKGWIQGDRSAYALGCVMACIALAGVIWACLSALLKAVLEEKENRSAGTVGRALAGILGSCLLFAAGFWGMERTIQKNLQSGVHKERLAADAEAVELILEAAQEPVWAGQIEELYRRRFSGISALEESPDTICRDKRGTILMNRDTELNALITTGARYAELSDLSSIYTYDEAVVTALQNAGYVVRGYYYTERKVDVPRQAGMPEKDDLNRTGLSLFANTYRTTYDLSVDPKQLTDPEKVLCTLKITAYEGDKEIVSKDVKAVDFDADGNASEVLNYTIPDTAGIAFNLDPRVPVAVNGIRYRKNPASDTWKTYNSLNLLETEQYFTKDGEPLVQSDGQYGAYYEWGFAHGKLAWLTTSYLDAGGTVMTGRTGYARRKNIYNTKGQATALRYLDVDRNLCMISGGYAVQEREYDQKGNIIVFRYLDTEEKPVMTKDNYAEIHRKYDDEKRIIQEDYFDISGAPCSMPAGYAGVEYKYDSAGNTNWIRYLGIDGMPIMRTNGYAELHRVFNGQKQIIEESYHDTSGALILLPGGYALLERGYDVNGNRNFEKYYGLEREPVRNTSGYGELHRTFEGTRVVRDDYFDVDGTPIMLKAGQYSTAYQYDDMGNISTYVYLGRDGKPVMRTDGFAELRRIYNEKYQIVRQEYYDTEGRPVNRAGGYFAVDYEYGENGAVKEERYYDTSGTLVNTVVK